MSSPLLLSFSDTAADMRGKIAAIYALLIAANLAAWAWALIAFHDYPVLLGTCFLAYSFGLRHAVDADHIAAIDNVTRKLMQEGKRPVAAGLFFSLGHSTVVVLATIAVAATAATFKEQLEDFHAIGGVIGTSVSAAFLLIIAAINVVILVNVYNTFRRVKNGGAYGWAFVKPVRKLYYNMTITFASVIVAVIIGGIETLGVIGQKFDLSGGVWDTVADLNDSFGMLGYLIIAVFAACWIASIAVYHLKGYDAIEVRMAPLVSEKLPA